MDRIWRGERSGYVVTRSCFYFLTIKVFCWLHWATTSTWHHSSLWLRDVGRRTGTSKSEAMVLSSERVNCGTLMGYSGAPPLSYRSKLAKLGQLAGLKVSLSAATFGRQGQNLMLTWKHGYTVPCMIQAAGGVMVDTPLAHVVRLSIKWANTTACLSIVADHVRPFMTSEHPSTEDVSSRTMHHVTKFKWLKNVVLNIISSLYANDLHMVIKCQNQEIYITDVLIHNLWALSPWIRVILKAKKGSNQILARYNKKSLLHTVHSTEYNSTT